MAVDDTSSDAEPIASDIALTSDKVSDKRCAIALIEYNRLEVSSGCNFTGTDKSPAATRPTTCTV